MKGSNVIGQTKLAFRLARRIPLGIIIVILTSIALGVVLGVLSVRSVLLSLLILGGSTSLLTLAYVFFSTGTFSLRRLPVALLFASILLPYIRTPGGIPDLRPELVLILAAWAPLIIGHLAVGRPMRFRPNSMHKWFAIFGLTIFLSMVYALVAKGYPFVGRDLWEFAKLLEYYLIFALVANMDISAADMQRYYKVALVVFLGSAFVGFAQYVDLGNINETFSAYYAPTKIELLRARGRIVGTTGNPNEFGGLMVLASSLALSRLLYLRGGMFYLFVWWCLAVFGFTIALTLSRSALVALAVAVGFIILIPRTKPAWIKRSLGSRMWALPVILVIVVLVLQLAPDMFEARISDLGDISSSTSWQARLTMWQGNLDVWKESPLLGWGPGKATMTTIVDNEWVLLLRRYGVIGVLVFVSWFVSFYSGLSRIRRNSHTEEVAALTTALQAVLLAYAVFMIPIGVYHLLQLAPILFFFLGLAYSQRRQA